jgi:elongation of very long chain fatty acids protein 4
MVSNADISVYCIYHFTQIQTCVYISFLLDPRVEKWPLMESPLPVLGICFLYLLLVYLGPKLVKNLQPLNLKITLVAYNFIVVGLSVYMFVEVS